MSRWFSLHRPFLAVLATVFAAAAVLYASVWMYVERYPGPRVELGYNKVHNEEYDKRTHSIKVGDVVQGSPAERAGLRPGDRIIGVNRQTLSTSAPFDEAYGRAQPGDAVDLTIQRDGEAWPLVLHGVFRATAEGAAPEGLAKTSALEVTRSFPVLFLVVGLAVLFLRVNDPNAWLLASLFCGIVATPSFSHPLIMNSALRSFALEYHAAFSGMLCSLFYIFFAVFPACSPVERRFGWLKWASLAFGVVLVLPGFRIGDTRIPGVAEQLMGERAAEMVRTLLIYGSYGLIGLALLSLGGNAFGRAATPEVRRKSRVILWGTVFGVLPIVIERAAIDFTGYRPSFWFNTLLVIVLALYPLSFAYAVVKHSVMEIPVLLRRSARYVLVQRGFIVLLFVAAVFAITFFTRAFSRFFQPNSNVGMMLSATFGIALVWLSAPLVKRGTQRIDRAFFRSAYDARVILQDLAEKTRTVTARTELAALLEQHLNKALRPKTFVCYVGADDSQLIAQSGTVPAGAEKLPSDLPFLVQLANRGKSWDVPPPGSDDAEQLPVLASLAPECLVPILDHDGRLSGLLVLGQRLSEEPYSSEDKRLLDSVASQVGMALENICLAEKMAERMEVDRRVARDMEIAREVQSRLFPQFMPPLETLEYAGTCIQARVVGGDYYDFLDLGPGRLGVVLADISGKGIAAALLMANLQANLRSQYAVALEDPHRLLQSVNRLFYENTPDDRYATLFFADYDDASRCLRYANCGHNPPLLLRANGELERLGATATVLGLFKDWNCAIEEVSLRPGDILLIYTDGITEAPDLRGEEFGESRLVEVLRSHPRVPVGELLSFILAAVQEFSDSSQADDLTVLIAQSR
jgi:sigma-B regulation protein RsbU (phosphoserine phosphatase)